MASENKMSARMGPHNTVQPNGSNEDTYKGKSSELKPVGPVKTKLSQPQLAAFPSIQVVDVKNKIVTALDTILQPTLANKACYRVFRSNEGISNERNRQRRSNRWIIHPFSPFRWYWDLIMVGTLLITLLSLPIEIAFYTFVEECAGSSKEAEATWVALHILADVVFIVDILLNFRTGYIHPATEEVILENKQIIVQYLKTWFIIDLISSTPFDYLYQLASGQTAGDCSGGLLNITLKVLRLTKLLSLLRILRVARLLRYIHKLEELLEIESKVISMFNLIMVIAMFSHWNGCIQFLTPYVEYYPDFPETSWVMLDGITGPESTTWMRYSRAIFRSMSHMLCIGYGLKPPKDIGETWTVMCSMTLGATFYALFIAHMSGLIMTMDSSGKKYEEKVSEVKQYMRFRRVPLDIQQKVLDYYDHKYQRKYFDEGTILFEPNMSGPIKRDIQLHNCKNLVEKVPFLSSASQEFLYDIICKLSFQVFFIGDTIVQAGRKGDCMYFLEHGRVEIVLPTGQLVNTLTDGAYFGEISLLLEDRRTASVVAVETCDVYQLTKADFDEVLDDHPTMKKVLENIAKQRLSDLRKEENLMMSPFIGASNISVVDIRQQILQIDDDHSRSESPEICEDSDELDIVEVK